MKKCHINLRELGIALLAPICITFVHGLIPSSLVSCVIIIILCGCIHHVYPWVFTTGDNRNNKNRTGTRSLSFLFCFCIFILIVITGLSLQFFSTGILNAIELHRPELLGSYRDMVRSSFSLNNGIFRVTTVMLLAPVCEELVFRGISLSSSRRAFTCRHSDAIAILLSALLFALYHGNLVQFCYALPMGILLALLATWTSSLLPSILLHITINVSSYFTGMLPFALPHTSCILATGITSAAGFIALYLLLRRSGKSHKAS